VGDGEGHCRGRAPTPSMTRRLLNRLTPPSMLLCSAFSLRRPRPPSSAQTTAHGHCRDTTDAGGKAAVAPTRHAPPRQLCLQAHLWCDRLPLGREAPRRRVPRPQPRGRNRGAGLKSAPDR
jgi:hypothetical protein